MKTLTVRWPIGPADTFGTLRSLAALPPPSFAGLRCRYFRAEPNLVRARYHFDTDRQLKDFVSKPAVDAAATILTRDTGLKPLSESVEDDRSWFDEIAQGGILDRPVFLVAAPRSGGALLLELLANSSHFWTIDGGIADIVEGIPGLHPACQGWDSHRLTELDADPEAVHALKVAFLAEGRYPRSRRLPGLRGTDRPSAIRLIERTSENTLRVPFLAAAFPDACFVFIHRDGRQNVSSLIEVWHDPASVRIPALPGWRRGAWHCLLPAHWRDYNDAELVDVAAFQWAAANQLALDDLEGLPSARWIAVDYGELVASPRAVVDRVLAFAGLEIDAELRRALVQPGPLLGVEPSSPIKWHKNPEFRESALAPHNVLRGRLRELGGPSAPPPRRGVRSSIRFACFTDRLCSYPSPFNPDWIVHPSYRFQIGASVPLGLVQRTRFRDRFLRDVPLVWLEDDATEVLYPFWVRREYASLLGRFEPGKPPPQPVSELTAQLAAAGLLVTRDEIAGRREAGKALAESARPLFATDRYCVLPSLLQADHVVALGRYYNALADSGVWEFGDAQVAERYGWHNESMARYFHYQLAGFVGRVAGERVRPSYCYVSAYRGDHVSLRPHVDRKQCVFTVSLWINDRSAAAAAPWPLWFHTPKGVVSVTQSASDAVLFRGCELPHWRDQPPPGGASTTIIFHYVPNDFIGVLD